MSRFHDYSREAFEAFEASRFDGKPPIVTEKDFEPSAFDLRHDQCRHPEIGWGESGVCEQCGATVTRIK